MLAWNDGSTTNLVADFGSGRGLYKHNGSNWSKLTDWDNTIELLEFGSDLVVDFGSGKAIYKRNSTPWNSLSTWSTGDKFSNVGLQKNL